MKEISQNDSKKKDDIHRKYSVHLAIPRTLRNEINIIDCINSCRGQKDLIHSQILQNSSISYDKSFISLHRLCKNKEEFKNYMLYSYSESQYTKIIDNLLDIEEKPELTIEKILINIFNKFITPGNVEMDENDILSYKSKIKLLGYQIEKSFD